MGDRTNPHNFFPGERINGRYRVEGFVGWGGIGTVYLVEDTLKAGQRVALKVLRNPGLTPAQQALFRNEFEVMTGLSHPNLAAVYDFEPLRGTSTHFFTMEYIAGKNLGVSARDLGWRDLLDLIVPVCRALAYMHSRSVIHFDLKPGNILVTPDRQIKVLDFGLSGAAVCKTGSDGLLTSRLYTAPELMLSPATVDYRSDLYSLGIILYELLANALPFESKNWTDLMLDHCYTPVTFDEKAGQAVPEWLRRIVLRLCAKEPADRYPSANAVIEEFNREGGLTYEVETRETRESYLLSSRFVAREDEFAAVMDHVERNLSDGTDKAPALFVAGVSGIGKSRLLREVRHRLQLSRRSFVEADCYEGSLSEFAPIVDAVRHVLTLMDARGEREMAAAYGPDLAKLDAQLAREKGWKSERVSEDPEAERRRIVQRVAEFLLEASGAEGVTLYISDLQWALPGTVDILAYLIKRLILRREAGKPVRFCLLGSYREDEVDGRPVARLLEEWRARGWCRELGLGPLSGEQVGRLLGSMLGIEAPPEAFVKIVHTESGGNPFFVEEMLRMLVENNDVYLEHGRWAVRDEIETAELPHSIAGALLKRVSLLDDGHRFVLEIIAAHARPLPDAALGRIVEGDPATLRSRLNTLQRRQMIRRLIEPEPAFRVVHDRVREAVCEAIPPERRRELHGRLAAGLTDVYEGRHDEVLYDLARHYWEAGDRERALAFSLRAAEKAYREYANEQGIVLYRRVLELLPPDTSTQVRFKLLEELGEMCYLTGAYGEALRCYHDLFAVTNDRLTEARLRRKQALVHLARGELGTARSRLWDAAEKLGGEHPSARFGYAWVFAKHLATHLLCRFFPAAIRPARDEPTRARMEELSAVYVRLAYVHFFTGPLGMILPILIQANTGERLGESPQLCHAHSTLGMVYGVLGLAGGARRYGESALEMARTLGRSLYLGRACEYRGLSHFYMAELDAALAAFTRGRRLLSESGDLLELEVCYAHLSYVFLFKGRYAAARKVADEGLKLLREADAMLMGKTIMAQSVVARARLGELEGARERMGEIIRMSRQAGDLLNLSTSLMLLGDILLAMGETEEAIRQLNNARWIREERGVVQEYVVGVYACLVRAHWEKYLRAYRLSGEPMDPAERRQVRAWSRKAVRLARLGHPNYLSPGLMARGLSLWLDGRTAAAQRCFTRGHTVARLQGADLWLADGAYEAGRCLMLSEKTWQEGIRYLQQAERLFAEQGGRVYLERTRELLKEEGTFSDSGLTLCLAP